MSLKENRSECEEFASKFLDERYAFEAGIVLFKPTKCETEQFRPTKTQFLLSYFIAGHDRVCDEDKGFAITLTKVRFENTGMILEEKRAISMGNYFTDLSGNEAK